MINMEVRNFNINEMIHVYLKYKLEYRFPELLKPGRNPNTDTSQRMMNKLLIEYYRHMSKVDKNFYTLNLSDNKKEVNPFVDMVVAMTNDKLTKNYMIKCFADYESWMDFTYWNIKVIQEALDHPDYTLARKVMPDGTVHLSVPKSILGDYDGEMFNSKLKLKSVKVKKPKRKRK